VTKSQKRDKCN